MRTRRIRTSIALTVLASIALSTPTPAGAVPVVAANPAPTTSTPAEALPAKAVGVRFGGNPRTVAQYEAWLGGNVGAVTLFLAGSSDEDFLRRADGVIRKFKGSKYRLLVFSTPLARSGRSLSQVAAGAGDPMYRRLAELLVAGGRGDDVVRLGWELNGVAFPWSAQPNPTAYAEAYRRVVTVMRSVPGADRLRFEWNVGRAGGPVPVAAWPGDEYVDVVGFDVYDRSYKAEYADPVVRWEQFLTDDSGFNWVRDFAAAHGKPIGLSEWGLSSRHVPESNPDNVYFIEQMRNWIDTNNVAYANYFENDTNYRHRLMLHYPRAAARYKQLFARP